MGERKRLLTEVGAVSGFIQRAVEEKEGTLDARIREKTLLTVATMHVRFECRGVCEEGIPRDRMHAKG